MKLNTLINKDFKFDKRLTQMLFKQNTLSQQDYKKHLKSLPDLTKDKDNMSAGPVEGASAAGGSKHASKLAPAKGS